MYYPTIIGKIILIKKYMLPNLMQGNVCHYIILFVNIQYVMYYVAYLEKFCLSETRSYRESILYMSLKCWECTQFSITWRSVWTNPHWHRCSSIRVITRYHFCYNVRSLWLENGNLALALSKTFFLAHLQQDVSQSIYHEQ